MPPFTLTRAHILAAFAPLAETQNLAARAAFFSHVDPNVVWTVTGSAHSMAGTRNSLRAHTDATFDRLAPRLCGPIKFSVVRVLLDAQPPPAVSSSSSSSSSSASSPSSSPSISAAAVSASSPPFTSSAASPPWTSSPASPSSPTSSSPSQSTLQSPDSSGQWACVELRGVATRKASGKPYVNDYLWLTRWNHKGQIDHVRSYHDTMLAEEVLREA
ncbi:hypothetical protein CDD81_4849 [Ophiocordyceps australis]|uniref:SnoaL-like domain-containing protein n=1 Tax=Ophiocordyceps australis TaxID=1399860 RepID=A0A2C5Y416_9HYPO|nr:hypothetical protein CDD81_4849 [Ophiocordyceps australis]